MQTTSNCIEVSDRLLSLLREWAKLAPSEARIEQEWDGGFSLRFPSRLVQIHGQITQSEYDFLFCRVLDAIAQYGDWEVKFFSSTLAKRGAKIWLWKKGEVFTFDGQGDRLTAVLSAYVQALKAVSDDTSN